MDSKNRITFAEAVRQLENGKPVYQERDKFVMAQGEILKNGNIYIQIDVFVERYLGDEFSTKSEN